MAFPNTTWSFTTTYAINALVNYAGLDYKSLQNGNLNQTPSSQPTWWSLNSDWSSVTTYVIGNTVTRNGVGYVSVANANTNHDPATAANIGPWWERILVRSTFSPPSVNGRVKVFATYFPGITLRTNQPFLTAPGAPEHMGHVGTLFYRFFASSPTSSPGPASVWQGRTVFRVPKSGWFFGLGQRANKTPVAHNSGD